MMPGPTLIDRLEDAVEAHRERTAVRHPEHDGITYGELARLSDGLSNRLHRMGVRAGDRVGLHLPKSVDAVVAIFGILKTGAAYVPVDVEAPEQRSAYILHDCDVRAVITDTRHENALSGALREFGATPGLLALGGPSDGSGLRGALEKAEEGWPATGVPGARPHPDDLAYVLYTSGSTGRPKGVRLTHRAALTFINWCETEFGPRPSDVYSSHAPLHFDLSIHDCFVPLFNGARLVVIDEATGKDPLRLADMIDREGISVWYSTPSILSLLALYGRMEQYDFDALRLVLFAGEVFPIPRLRAIKALWTTPRYYNLYGPTETNVCTYFEIPATIPEDRTEPFPIGRMCPPLEGRAVDESGRDVPVGEKGELVVRGPSVMEGYWNLPEQNERAFLIDQEGLRWYRTGDVVVQREDGVYEFHGRRDRMVKRRGYRVELGEIEAALATHPAVKEVAVVALPEAEAGVRIKAYVATHGPERPGVIEMKRFSVGCLPRYMIPDVFGFVERLPRTSTDKVDYRALQARA